MLQLLRGEAKGVEALFSRAASAVIKEMLRQYPELAQKYVLSPIIEPLAQNTRNPGIMVTYSMSWLTHLKTQSNYFCRTLNESNFG